MPYLVRSVPLRRASADFDGTPNGPETTVPETTVTAPDRPHYLIDGLRPGSQITLGWTDRVRSTALAVHES